MMIGPFLKKMVSGIDLTEGEAFSLMSLITSGKVSDAQIGSFITAMKMKGVTIDELTAFARVLQDHALPMNPGDGYLVDTCGTGGDGANTFNISTAAAIVAAAAGVKVVKHGNRSVSSSCGSADVLEALGVPVDTSPEQAADFLQTCGIAFLYAPRYHPAMGRVAQARRELGFFSVFNILGPLLNPAKAQARLIGVGDSALLSIIPYVLQNLGILRAMVVYGDGTDEITVTGKTDVIELIDNSIRKYQISPEDFNINPSNADELKGGNAVENAKIIREVLTGREGPGRDVVLMNAAAAITLGGGALCLQEGFIAAKDAIDSGKAAKTLELMTGGKCI